MSGKTRQAWNLPELSPEASERKVREQSPQSSGPSTAVPGGSLPPPLLSRRSLVAGFGAPSTIFRKVYVYSSPSPPILNLSGVSLDAPAGGFPGVGGHGFFLELGRVWGEESTISFHLPDSSNSPEPGCVCTFG